MDVLTVEYLLWFLSFAAATPCHHPLLVVTQHVQSPCTYTMESERGGRFSVAISSGTTGNLQRKREGEAKQVASVAGIRARNHDEKDMRKNKAPGT